MNQSERMQSAQAYQTYQLLNICLFCEALRDCLRVARGEIPLRLQNPAIIMYQNALSYPSIIPQVHTYLHISVGLKSTTRIPARRIPFGNKDAKQYQRASSISLLVNYRKSELTSTEGEKPPSQRSFVKIDELHSKLLKSKLTHSHAQPTRNPSTHNIQTDTFVNIPTPDNLEHLPGLILFLSS